MSKSELELVERNHRLEITDLREHHSASDYERLLDRLAYLAQTLGTARDLLTIFRALRDFAVASTPCHGIFISLYDPDKNMRNAIYAWGEGEEVDLSDLPPMPMTDSPHSRSVLTGKIIITDDFQSAIKGQPQLNLRLDVDPRLPRSSLAAPMAVMGRTVGAVEVQSSNPAAFKPEHATAMRMAANLAAIAIENVRLFERERKARSAAEDANRLKDEFLATLSHELRTPLTAILGWARLLNSGMLDNENTVQALHTIERNAKSQAHLIDDLLDISRIITGKLHLDTQQVELPSIIDAVIHAVHPAAEAKSIRLEKVIDRDVGTVAGDPNRIQQVVWNLLSNAIKFTPDGGFVEVRLERTDSQASIVVSDTGQGINPIFLPYVFDRFRQADSTMTRRQGGLGLGLAIVRHLIEMHGGAVTADSAGEGQGATFTVTLPLLSPTDRVENQKSYEYKSLGTRSKPRKNLKGLRVLVVDDEFDARELFNTVLSQHGADVRTSSSAAEALETIEGWRPNLLVSDIGMPGEDGLDLIKKVRAREPERCGKIPALALTAYASNEDRRRVLSAGYHMHVAKPVGPEELMSAILSLSSNLQD